MTGHCRFLRVKGGICSFADVELHLMVGGQTVELVDALPAKPNRNGSEVNRQSHGSWVRASLDGILDAVSHAQQSGLLRDGCRVELTKLLGTDVDTREDAVRCAAGLATWQALGGPPLDAVFDGGQWTVPYPACLEPAVHGTQL